jgi:hypothetical protein
MEASKLIAISYNDEVDAVSYFITLLIQFHWQNFRYTLELSYTEEEKLAAAGFEPATKGLG